MVIETCRGCGGDQLTAIVSLGEQPLANALTAAPAPAEQPRFPLDLVMCRACSLVQLSVSVPPEELFTDYTYFSSFSPTLVRNAAQLVERIVDARALGADDLAVEIGSNDGYLLQHYRAAGVAVLGIDPAENVAAAARERGIPTEVTFFGEGVGRRLAEEGRQASVLHANNVLAHVPDVNGVLRGIAQVLADEGVALIETPYVRDLVDHLEFDTIYHEHLFYYSVTALERLCRRNGLRIDDIERIPVHGGSLRVFAVRNDGQGPPAAVGRYLAEEERLGLPDPAYYQHFGRRVDALREELRRLLARLRDEGASIAGYGAAAKATVLLNAIGATQDTVVFVADRSPHKQGLHIPGVGVPIVDPEVLVEQQPDYVLLLAWNFADEILAQQAAYRASGGRFIIPLPTPRIIDPDDDTAHSSGITPAS